MQTRSRKRGIRASRERLNRALAGVGLSTQAALAERIADLEDRPTAPRDLVSRAFREMPVDPLSLERIARALRVEAHTLYKTSLEGRTPGRRNGGPRAIAVLPFLNLGQDGGSDYFCDGLTEELLNGLARVPGLRVAGHTSSFFFKGRQYDVGEASAKLGVEAVLEGSVRVHGEQVRITAQLVNAGDGLMIWSGRYDRELGNLFAVQDEIRDSVIGALEVALLGVESRPERDLPSANPAAVSAWLQGRFFWNKRTVAGARKACAYYERAARLDPQFAPPLAGLADAHRLLSLNGACSIHAGYRNARVAARKALALDSGLAEAYRSLALIGMEYDWDWEAVAANCARAMELGAGKAEIRGAHAGYLEIQGRLDAAVEERRHAVLLEPLWAPAAAGLALTLTSAGRYAEARAAYTRVFELDPTYPANFGLASLHYLQGDYMAALEEFSRDSRDALRFAGQAMVHARLGDLNGAHDSLRSLIDGFSHVAPAQITQVYVQWGEWKNAWQWLDRACEARDPGVVEITFNPFFAPLREKRAYGDYVRRIGIAGGPGDAGRRAPRGGS